MTEHNEGMRPMDEPTSVAARVSGRPWPGCRPGSAEHSACRHARSAVRIAEARGHGEREARPGAAGASGQPSPPERGRFRPPKSTAGAARLTRSLRLRVHSLFKSTIIVALAAQQAGRPDLIRSRHSRFSSYVGGIRVMKRGRASLPL